MTVQQRLEEVRREDEAIHSRREWLMHVDQVFQAKIPAVWKQLFRSVENIVNEWNNGLSVANRSLRIELQPSTPRNELMARRVIFPTVRVVAWVDKGDHSLRFSVRRKVDHETPESIRDGRLRIQLCEGDNELHFYDGEEILPECADAAEVILEPLFSGRRKIGA